jgi:ribosomal RNA-processing protein 8
MQMRARLQGGHFRMLNERLYTSRGGDAFAAFQKDPAQFQHYHRGYQEQMSHWPKLPVEVVGEWLRARAPTLKVADFGCGGYSDGN